MVKAAKTKEVASECDLVAGPDTAPVRAPDVAADGATPIRRYLDEKQE